MRLNAFSRNLQCETTVSTNDLIYPVFIVPGTGREEPIASMPGVKRQSLDLLLKTAKACLDLNIPALALFPVIGTDEKSIDAKEAYNPEGLVPTTVAALKKEFPDLGVITDIALDPYTTHGQDGLIDSNGYVVNDATIAVLQKQALCHAMAGADIVAPSDMMDGRIGSIRSALDQQGFINTGILAYAAKYASNFYGPFRDAVGSSAAFG
jgi:porphobilinogen synthase